MIHIPPQLVQTHLKLPKRNAKPVYQGVLEVAWLNKSLINLDELLKIEN
jgi:hypothetical protein